MTSINREIRIVQNATQLARVAAAAFASLAEQTVAAKGSFSVALAGGSTPKAMFVLLADASEKFRARVPWSHIHFFWGDERHVPPDHAESNYRMAAETLLSRVPVPPEHIHRIRSERADASQAAQEYELELRDFFKLEAGQWPRFDLALLGMGADGHTASLFPGTTALHEQMRLAVAVWVQTLQTYRITLTPPVFNHAARVIFMVSGQEKAETLRRVLEGEYQPERWPSQLIAPQQGHLLWLIDQAAASLLSPHLRSAFASDSLSCAGQ